MDTIGHNLLRPITIMRNHSLPLGPTDSHLSYLKNWLLLPKLSRSPPIMSSNYRSRISWSGSGLDVVKASQVQSLMKLLRCGSISFRDPWTEKITYLLHTYSACNCDNGTPNRHFHSQGGGPGSHIAVTGPFSSVQSLSHVWLFVTPWTAAHQASLSITNSQSPPKTMSIVSVMPSNHLVLCCPLLLLPSIFSSIRVFSNESVLHIR